MQASVRRGPWGGTPARSPRGCWLPVPAKWQQTQTLRPRSSLTQPAGVPAATALPPARAPRSPNTRGSGLRLLPPPPLPIDVGAALISTRGAGEFLLYIVPEPRGPHLPAPKLWWPEAEGPAQALLCGSYGNSDGGAGGPVSPGPLPGALPPVPRCESAELGTAANQKQAARREMDTRPLRSCVSVEGSDQR